jgi:hypothetical protein
MLWFSLDIAFSERYDIVSLLTGIFLILGRNILRSNFDVLSRASIASFALLLIWYDALQLNKRSGSSKTRYQLWLGLLIGINAVAMFFQMSGAILFYAFLLANKNLGTTIRQSIILVRFQLLRLRILTYTGWYLCTSNTAVHCSH